MSYGIDNRRKRVQDESPGPWTDWTETNRADRCIKFIETYCRPPKGYNHGKVLTLGEFQKQFIREILKPGVNAAALQLPRGNGKSTLLAAIAVWALFDSYDSGLTSVPICATTVGQAERSVYDVAVKMIEAEPELSSRCMTFSAIGNKRVTTNAGGTMFPIANDVDGLQGLDFSLAVADEVGFQPVESWTSLVLATGKRPSALVVGIGTPGLDRDNALFYMRQMHLEGRAPSGFVFEEYSAPEGCDFKDPENWLIANPALAEGFVNQEVLRNNAEMMPESHFRIFHLGQWVDGAENWLGPDGRKIWGDLKDPYPPVPGAPTWVGLDVGIKYDSTAVVYAQPRLDGTLQVWAKIFFPTKGQVVDPADVMQFIRDLDQKYTLREVAYDPRLFEYPALMLADEGIPMVEFPQSLERMTPAFAGLYEAIHNKSLHHDGDPAFATQILNGVLRPNERGFTLAKAKSRGKIDAACALAMCYSRASQPMKPRNELFIGWSG